MARGRACLPKNTRLHHAREFRRVFAHGHKSVSAGFVVIAAPGEADRARLGLALAKRRIARAVDRNRVKRVLRESFRRKRADLGSVDIVVVARGPTANMSNAELFAQLAQIWPRVTGRQVSRGSRNPRRAAARKNRNSAHG